LPRGPQCAADAVYLIDSFTKAGCCSFTTRWESLREFHKVHHTATVLTPLTNFRVHPVYMCIFLNILAVFTGFAGGIGEYLLGATTHQYGLSENNIILVFFIYVYVHLQHSQV
jgi:sterol desaturase/sphingolipid hydroxylase (fatty acid hydroxylase superfamily)